MPGIPGPGGGGGGGPGPGWPHPAPPHILGLKQEAGACGFEGPVRPLLTSELTVGSEVPTY